MNKPATAAFSAQEIQQRIDSVGFWFHSIDVGGGLTTPGRKSAQALREELDSLRLPDLRGKTVLDIGAFDGFYSFEAEARGASAVTAVDHYVWSMDLVEHDKHWKESSARGVIPKAYQEMPYWRPNELPGKRAFDVAHELRGSNVRPIVADFMEMDLKALGTFDVVLYLGVLYHMENPLESLKRVAAVTREVAVIETHAIAIPGLEDRAICEFYETNELNNDVSNWWGPNRRALEGLCRAAGFSRVDTIVGRGSVPIKQRVRGFGRMGRPAISYYRAVVHAWK